MKLPIVYVPPHGVMRPRQYAVLAAHAAFLVREGRSVDDAIDQSLKEAAWLGLAGFDKDQIRHAMKTHRPEMRD